MEKIPRAGLGAFWHFLVYHILPPAPGYHDVARLDENLSTFIIVHRVDKINQGIVVTSPRTFRSMGPWVALDTVDKSSLIISLERLKRCLTDGVPSPDSTKTAGITEAQDLPVTQEYPTLSNFEVLIAAIYYSDESLRIHGPHLESHCSVTSTSKLGRSFSFMGTHKKGPSQSQPKKDPYRVQLTPTSDADDPSCSTATRITALRVELWKGRRTSNRFIHICLFIFGLQSARVHDFLKALKSNTFLRAANLGLSA
ncbi:hypothetical protein BJ165DRAFT_1405946 [Panaeolus papilionaceus]|nr:hypothetical protein BJ165DRAFT_1405946 [Panaeolus papilionaceus]